MYRQAYQRGMLTIFYSVGAKPLAIWDTVTRDGYVTRFLDDDIKSMVLEIGGTNVSTTYMICPKGNAVLGITMPFLVMVVKNLRKYFSFEITILDETGTRRRFRVSNFQSTTQVLPLCTVMPIGLTDGWNQIQFNLAEFTRRAYKKQFVEVQKVKINANIRLRRVYFAERIVPDEQLPAEYKLFFPLKQKPTSFKDKKTITDLTPQQPHQQQSQLQQPHQQLSQQRQPQLQQSQHRQPQLQQSQHRQPQLQQSQHRQPQLQQSQPQQQKHQQKFEQIDDDPDQIPELKKKDDKTSKFVGSMQVIKTASHLQDLNREDLSSELLHVEEDPLDRTHGATEVPVVAGLISDTEPALETTSGNIQLFEEKPTEAQKETGNNMESVVTAVEKPATEDEITTGYEEDDEEGASTEQPDEAEE